MLSILPDFPISTSFAVLPLPRQLQSPNGLTTLELRKSLLKYKREGFVRPLHINVKTKANNNVSRVFFILITFGYQICKVKKNIDIKMAFLPT